jgi:transposase
VKAGGCYASRSVLSTMGCGVRCRPGDRVAGARAAFAEVRALRASGRQTVLTKTRWILLKRPANLTRGERHRLRDLLAVNLKSVRAYLLKEEFQRFWRYRSRGWAARFLDAWIRMTMRSRIEPLKKFARTLRTYRYELDNWFFARQQLAAGAVEGFNNKARITTRKAYGFGTPGGIRTPDTWLRRPPLYPAELRARTVHGVPRAARSDQTR